MSVCQLYFQTLKQLNRLYAVVQGINMQPSETNTTLTAIKATRKMKVVLSMNSLVGIGEKGRYCSIKT